MDEKMCKCVGCGHEAMCEVGSKCSECGGEMKEKMEGGEMGDDAAGADMAGGADEKPME